MKYIALTNTPLVAVVDDNDFALLAQRTWHMDKDGYARLNGPLAGAKCVLMHHVILMVSDKPLVDHINRNRLDNRRENLRKPTWSELRQNTKNPRPGRHSRFHGVSRKADRWCAQIMQNGKSHWLGWHASEEAAALAYDRKAIELYGQYARTNLTPRKEPS